MSTENFSRLGNYDYLQASISIGNSDGKRIFNVSYQEEIKNKSTLGFKLNMKRVNNLATRLKAIEFLDSLGFSTYYHN